MPRLSLSFLSTIVLAMIFASVTAAESVHKEAVAQVESFKFDDRLRRFTVSPDRRTMLTESCFPAGVLRNCTAAQMLRKASLRPIEKQLHGGMNPGSVICKSLGGDVLIGTDADKNQNSFCQFEDKSIVDNGTLAYYASLNDKKK